MSINLTDLKLGQSAIFETDKAFIKFTKILVLNENLTKVFKFSMVTQSKKNGHIAQFPNIDIKDIDFYQKKYCDKLKKIN